ncbi:MAG: Gfo/Idh/MocA family oxidoreductase [Chloroflexota bacterium]
MSARQLRFGMIGCGGIAAATAQGIVAAEHAALTAVTDTTAALAESLARTHGVPWTATVGEILARDDVDAVYIALPHDLHAPLTLQAAAAGKHVLCETALAPTLADADRMIDACREAGVVLSATCDAQVTPSLAAVRAVIDGGAIGQVIGTRIMALLDSPPGAGKRGSVDGVDRLMMGCIQAINAVRRVTGLDVTRVYAEYAAGFPPDGAEDYGVVTVRYTNGAVGYIEAGSCLGGADAAPGISIYGTTGQVVLGNAAKVWTAGPAGGQDPGAAVHAWREIESAGIPHPRAPLVEGFAAAVLEGRPPPVSAADARAALEVVLAAGQAGRDGRPVELGVGMLEAGSRLRDVQLSEGSDPAFVFHPRVAIPD